MMFAILRHYGIPDKIVQAIRVLYENSTSSVFVDGKLSKEFSITTGVLQGDVLAPTLFIIVMDYIMRLASKDNEGDFGLITHPRNGSRMPEKRINYLAFADDLAGLEGTLDRSQKQLDKLSSTSNKAGLEISDTKTVRMELNTTHRRQEQINLNGKEIDLVDDFKYLGSMMASSQNDIKYHKSLAWTAFWKLKNLWRSTTTSLHLKLRFFKAACLTILLYGGETWILTKQLALELDRFATNCYRIILNIKRIDHIPNSEIYAKTKQIPLSLTLKERQLRWVGHILRINEKELIRQYALYEPSLRLGTAKRGQPKLNYVKYIGQLINENHLLTAAEIEKAAQNRESWKKLVVDCTRYVAAHAVG